MAEEDMGPAFGAMMEGLATATIMRAKETMAMLEACQFVHDRSQCNEVGLPVAAEENAAHKDLACWL